MTACRTTWLIALGCAFFAGAVPAADDQNFDIWEIRVQGNSLLDNRTIEQTVYPYLGPQRNFADVQAARADIEKLYRDAGYPTVYVDLPEQTVRNGLVKVRVTEGVVSSVRVTGARYYSNGWIRANVPDAKEGSVPRLSEFNQQIVQLNSRSMDRKVTPVLRPGDKPGTVDLELKVKDELPVHGSLEVNNRNTVDTTNTRVVGELSYGNLWQRDHSVSLLYQVAPEDKAESEFWALNYSFRPELSSTTYALFAVKSNSNTETSGAIGVIGKGTIIGGRAVRPLAGSNNLFHSVIFGLDYKDFDQSVGFEDTIDTPIKYVNWTAGYTGVLFEGGREHNINGFANAGVRGLVNETDQFTENRQGSQPNYFYLRASYDVLQPTPFDTAAFFRLTSQWTAQPLISNEQFSVGGVDTVRGFYEAEALGDHGVQATLELRSPDLGVTRWEAVKTNYFYLFTDGGALRNESSPGTSGEDQSVELASAGIGWRFDGLGLTGNLNWAYTLQAGPVTPKGDDRLLFLMRYGF